ncbi:MAG: response regulator [Deltaproteobacteria bacterium]|nr:response regulator [Deltaproteobacteria bacterium]MBN2670941.1 response regulator [Deltaproteobacteria bacterium]
MEAEKSELLLIIDDDLYVRESISMYFEDLGYEVLEAENGAVGLDLFHERQPDMVFCDLRMPEMDGLDVLQHISSVSPETPVVVISGAGRIQDVVDALRRGAWNFITKPVEDMAVLGHVASQALEKARLRRENRRYHQYLEDEVVRRTRQLAKSTAQAKVLAEEAKAASRAKGEFLANMSHELRTPLNSISVLSRVLAENREGNLSDKQLKMLDQISSSGYELLGLVNEVLEVTRLESTELRLDMKMISVQKFVHKIERIISPLAWEKGLSYSIEVADDAPETFFSDTLKASRIVRILISNAVKFTAEGTITIRVEPAPMCEAMTGREYAAGEALLVHVIDTGIGIAPEQQQQIFNMFKQADSADTRHYQGTGLGLTIASRFAAALEGDIWVKSAPGKGSQFSVLFPVQSDIDSREIKVISRAPTAAHVTEESLFGLTHPLFNGEKVLVADSDMRLVFNMSAMLETIGAEVNISSSVSGLMQRLKSTEQLDLIVLHQRLLVDELYDAFERIDMKIPPIIVVLDDEPTAITREQDRAPMFFVDPPLTAMKVIPLIKEILW